MLLKNLHPSEPEAEEFEVASGTNVELSTELCNKMLMKVPTISEPGPSGLRSSHLKPFLSASVDDRVLAQVLTKITNGSAPNWMRMARLIGIKKPNGGARPIAIEEILKRLAASALNECFLSGDHVRLTNQLSIIKDDALIGAYVNKRCILLGHSVVMVDTTNAFNSLLRKKLLQHTKSNSKDTQRGHTVSTAN